MSVKWESLKDKGNEEFKKHNYSTAISLYSDSISKIPQLTKLTNLELDPNQDSTYANRGLCYLNLRKFNQAKSDLNKAIIMNSKNMKALKRLAYCHLTLGELLEAEMFVKRCVEVEPEDESHKADVIIVRNLIAARDELNKAKFTLDYKTSEALAEKILQKCSEATNVKLIFIECLLHNCKPQQALTIIKTKVNDDEGKKEEFQFLLCQAYYHDGKYEKAKQILTTLIAMADEKNSEKYKSLWDNLKRLESEKEKANDLFKKGDYDGAINLYANLLSLDSNNKSFIATILANRALCYQKKNKLFDALSDINKSIALNENYWKAYYRRATINIALKNGLKAKEDLSRVLVLDPNNRDAVLLVDDIEREEKKTQRRDFYKILDLKRDSTPEEIRKSFKKLASQWHPDKNSGTEEMREYAEKMFKDVNEAYNILSDPKKRKIYDQGGHPDDLNSAFHTQHENETYEENYNSFFGQQPDYRFEQKVGKSDKKGESSKYERNYSSNKKYHKGDDNRKGNEYSANKKHKHK